jgi:hypothetical protein
MKSFVKQLQVLVILTLISVSLAGCATNLGSAWVKPINPTTKDISCMSRPLKQQILTHNETWEKEQ